MRTTSLLVLALAGISFGCAKKTGTTQAVATTGVYTYEYPAEGCTTGLQKPDSLNAYCETLRDEKVNHNCAVESRYEAFRSHCPEQTWNHYDPQPHHDRGPGPGRRRR